MKWQRWTSNESEQARDLKIKGMAEAAGKEIQRLHHSPHVQPIDQRVSCIKSVMEVQSWKYK